jgi:hypothetical protein
MVFPTNQNKDNIEEKLADERKGIDKNRKLYAEHA